MKPVKLFETFAESGFHSSFCTTFDVDFGAYESVALSRLREKRCTNNVLIVDGRMLTYALDGKSLPSLAGSKYSVVGVTPSAAGAVFHPKLVLKLGEKKGCLLVTSANMTSAGLAGNLEVVGQVILKDPSGPEAGMLRAAFDYLIALLPPEAGVAREQLDWAKRRAPWLDNATPSDAIVEDDGQVLARFLAHSSTEGIGSRFLGSIGKEPIRRLVVVSPYWDTDLAAVSWLQESLQAQESSLLIQHEAALFPKTALGSGLPVQVFPIQVGKTTKGRTSRFVHAKVIIAQADDADHVLYGSTNCTTPALGNGSFAGKNQEASLYRRLAPGQAIELLGLGSSLDPEEAIDAETLPNLELRDEIPLEECQRRNSGSFELKAGVLSWQRPRGLAGADGKLEFRDAYGSVVPIGATPLSDDGDKATFGLEAGALPTFARLVREGERFAPAVVMSVEALQFARLPATKQASRSKLEFFEDPDTLESLKFLTLLAEFARLDEEATDTASAASVARSSTKEEAEKEPSHVLPYEEFILRRSTTPSSGLAESSTGTGYADAVRQALNRITGVRTKSLRKQLDEQSSDFLQIGAVLDIGDETANREQAVEMGSEVSRRSEGAQKAAEKRRQTVRKLQAFRQTQKTIVKALTKHLSDERAAAISTRLKPVSLLKLRVLLSVLLSTGCSSENLEAKAVLGERRIAALLPCRGANNWPQLAGRLLFEVFRLRSTISENPDPDHLPLVRFIDFPHQDGSARLPVDVAECLFMCQWVVQALCCAVDDKGKVVHAPSQNMVQLRADVYMASQNLLKNDPEEALREQTWEGLDALYGEQLGVDGKRIRARHEETRQALNAPTLV
ncbi:hypothetical protein J2W30_006895 [Variovorax boronicumulans]|uniref:phospholipase D family protein n=1 Tax=Variovorax boronicumulans TaxID=436515 RepID=UPI0027801F7F|nr:phospholipase D family protein [Variovorax boronicumulans]MDQ0039102.1 hypothetical protein [Variovorax boronicumulans]